MNEHDIEPIDLVVVNLYPFDETIKKDGVTLDEAVENIDIGGPAMIRSAAKNWRDVAVVTDARLYDYIIHQMWQCDGCLPLETRQCLATIAYLLTSRYDSSISAYIGQGLSEEELEQVEPFDSLRQLFERTGQTDYSEPVKDSLPEWDSIELSKLVNARGKIEAAIDDLVEQLVAAGVGWGAIGTRLGMTRQGARQAFLRRCTRP